MVAQGGLWEGSRIHCVVSVSKAVGEGAGFVDVLSSRGLITGMMTGMQMKMKQQRGNRSYLCLCYGGSL